MWYRFTVVQILPYKFDIVLWLTLIAQNKPFKKKYLSSIIVSFTHISYYNFKSRLMNSRCLSNDFQALKLLLALLYPCSIFLLVAGLKFLHQSFSNCSVVKNCHLNNAYLCHHNPVYRSSSWFHHDIKDSTAKYP